MAKFEKGRAKTGGRTKGTPNKAQKFSKDFIQQTIDEYVNSGLFANDMKAMQPKERIDAISKLVGYIIPKLQASSVDISMERVKTIEDTLIMLAEENEN
jgi:hypothetical protein